MPLLGQIVLTAYAGAFNGAVAAHGALLSTANHPGGNGTTTFGIPNLHGKAPTGLHYRVCTRGAFPSRF